MSPEIKGWNPAFVFGVAFTVAVIVIGWMWTGGLRRTNFRIFARDAVVTLIILWVPVLAWHFGWVSPRTAVVIGLVLLIANAIRRRQVR